MRRKKLLAIPVVVLAAAALFAETFSASPLPEPAPLTGALPVASPPAEMAVYQLPTGVTHRSAGFAYRGGSLLDKRDFAMTAVLVRHPQGDLLIDTGFGRTIDAQLQTMPSWFRATTSYTRGRSAAEQLDAAGYDRAALRAILLTHAHWDHVSGVPEFPGKPVWVTAEERRFIADGGFVTALARSLGNVRYEEYEFEGGPYLGFARSHDVYGDGSVVVVPAPGHTPGSVIVFLTLPDGKRFALLGDLVWQREGVTQREERPWLQRLLADADASGVRDGILHVSAIAARLPDLILVPAHDSRGFAAMPRLPETMARSALAAAAVNPQSNLECPARELIPIIDSSYHECNHGFVNGSCERFVATFRKLTTRYDCQRPFDQSPVPAIWLANDAAMEDYVQLVVRLASTKKDPVLSGKFFAKACSEARAFFGSEEFRSVLDGALAEEYGERSESVERGAK